MNKIHLLIFFSLLGVGIPSALGQNIPGRLSEEAKISILTVGPAEPAYTAFGHSAIRLQAPRYQIDWVYNYGTFNFEASAFYLSFLYGDLNYHLSVQSFEQFKESNMRLGRSIVSQSLNLSQKQINELVQTLERNSLPENRSYHYQFFHQNCVTQVRDLLAAQDLWSPSQYASATALSTPTYRQKVGVYLTNRPWMQLGVNLMLGAGTDDPLNEHEQIFLPNALHLSLASATDDSGQKLVASSRTIATAAMQESGSPTQPVFIFWLFFWFIAAITTASFLLDWQSWWIDRLLFGAVGLLGSIMAFGAFVSLHEPLQQNWNLLWALPTHLLVAFGLRTFSPNKWLRPYFWITIALGIVVVAGWQLIPQQLPLTAVPIICSLIIRSAFRLYAAIVQARSSAQKTRNSTPFSTYKMSHQPVKTPNYE